MEDVECQRFVETAAECEPGSAEMRRDVHGNRSGQFFLFGTGHIGKTGVYLPFRDAGGGRFAKAKRKVRTPQGRESSIKRGCHGPYSMRRKAQQKTNRRSNPARVKRRGKSPPRFQEIEPAVQAPPGARPNRE